MRKTTDLTFGTIMAWTVATTIFAWLPLVRILGRPEGYTWGVLGLSGSGTSGPFWVFIPAAAFAVALLFSAHRAPRAVFRGMLILWHAGITGLVIAGTWGGGSDAVLQGQGLRFTFPLWVVAIPCGLLAVLSVWWSVLDAREGGGAPVRDWSPGNTRRLVGSLLLLGIALVFFRAGTNYNWVTAVAILLTVAHWIQLARSFEPILPGASAA